MDFGDPVVRSWNDIFQAFDPDKVFWLLILLGVEFITGVALAFKNNRFDWDKVFDISKKNIIIVIAWGAAFIYNENAGNVVYGLALTYIGGAVVVNIMALINGSFTGVAGQLLTRGPGDATVSPSKHGEVDSKPVM